MNKMVNGAKIKYSGDSLVGRTVTSVSKGGKFLIASEGSSHWFGGVIDTLTSFGVLKFFFMFAFFLTFVRLIFNESVASNPIGFTQLLEIMQGVPTFNLDWFNNLIGVMNTGILNSGNNKSILSLLVMVLQVLLFIPKLLIMLLTGAVNIIIVLGYFFTWLTAGSVVFTELG